MIMRGDGAGLMVAAFVLALPLPAQPPAAYTGSQACEGCHPKIAAGFRKTGMGRSMADPATLPLNDSARITSEKLNRVFEVNAQSGELFQAESETEDDHTVFRNVHKLDYAIGSGDHGVSFITKRGNYLFQAPLSWYSQTGEWALSPGYENADYGFNRPIQAGCIVCHSGGPQPVLDRNGQFGDPPFRELAIGCESCHGPGQAHVKHPSRDSIVNPARLAPRLADNICMLCHEGGDARVLQPGKDYASFRPGVWLGDSLAIFKIGGADASVDLLEHHDAMSQSRCFSASKGKLSCITCHNPHRHIERAEAPRYYRERCLTCHTDRSCGLPIAQRQPENDCAACHMPKRSEKRISHTALTNHRILARPSTGEPAAQTEPDLVWLNPPPGATAPPPITLLKAYAELKDKRGEFKARYLSLLEKLEKAQASDTFVQLALGQKLLYDAPGADASAALAHLEKALNGGDRSAAVHQHIAEALVRLNRIAEAVDHLKHAVELEPYDPVLHKTLALRLIAVKRYPEALAEMRRYVDLFPEDDFMRGLLAQASASK